MNFLSTGMPVCARLDTTRRTLVLASFADRLPCVVYCGSRLGDDEDLAALSRAAVRPIANSTLDRAVELSICPEEGRGFQGHPGLRAFDAAGRPLMTQFRLSSLERQGDALVVEAVDAQCGLTYRARFATHPDTEVIEVEADLTADREAVRVDWLSTPVVPAPASATDFIEFAGRWTQEFGLRRVPFTRGAHLRESRRGRMGHDHFPAFVVPDAGCTDTLGEAIALHFGFSGVHRMVAEETAEGLRQLQAGVAEPAMLEPGETLSSECGFLAFSDEGLNGLMHALHDHVRRHVVRFPDPARPRPVHYNCWEAVYFDHDLDTLKELADRAAAIGAERFVLDDGWFGSAGQGRDDDTTSLGDWYVDPRKYPDGLGPLIDHVETLGMRFGLWVEPEMVSPDSALARAHPDWIIQPEGRVQLPRRSQQVLDLTNADVADYLFERLDALLSQYSIDYLKWDMNRDLTLAVDREGNGLLRRQGKAVHALIDRVRAAHPGVEIESCASGGARIDYEILKRTHRVWLSDSNDAHERARMQHEAMLFLPPEIVGSHVGPRRCHTSGRVLAMPFRAGVAMAAHMGFEMDLRELEPDEEATLKRYTRFYKENRTWMHAGRQHRLEPACAERLAHMSVAADRAHFLAFVATLATIRDESAPPIRLSGLDPDAHYRVTLWNRDEINASSHRRFAMPIADPDGLVLSGRALMKSGVTLPMGFPDTMWIVQGTRTEGR